MEMPPLDRLVGDPAATWATADEISRADPLAGLVLRFNSRSEALRFRTNLYSLRKRINDRLAKEHAKHAANNKVTDFVTSGWDHLVISLTDDTTLWIGTLTAVGVGLKSAAIGPLDLSKTADDELSRLERHGGMQT